MSNSQSYTIWSPQDTVKDVAESLGLENVNDDVLKALAMDVEYRILEIIEQAVKFKRHSKTDILTTDDVAKALRVLNVEPLYGYHETSFASQSSGNPSTSGSNSSAVGNNTMNGGATADAKNQLSFSKVNTAGGQQVYYLNEEEVDFDKLINEPLPAVPRLPTFTTHWLAIEGVQPNIIQNPNLNEIRTTIPPTTRGAIVTALNDNSIQTITNNSSANGKNIANGKAEKTINNQPLSSVKPGQNIEVKPLVKHVLSKELQIYFDKIIGVLTAKEQPENPAANDKLQHMKAAALASLRTDSGLHQLVPYFIQFIAEQITHNLSDLTLLTTILEMIYSLLSNQSIFLEPYIHSLMPSILTLLLAKKLGGSPSTSGKDDKSIPPSSISSSTKNSTESVKAEGNEDKKDEESKDEENKEDATSKDEEATEKKPDTVTTEVKEDTSSSDEYKEYLESTNALRDFAASLLEYVLKKFPQLYKTLKPRVTRTLLKTFLDTNRVFGTYYGCLKGFSVLESEAVRFFLGNVYSWSRLIFNEQNLTLEDLKANDGNPNIVKFNKFESDILVETIINALCILKNDLPEIYDGKTGEVTDEDKQKLVKRCGVTISYYILKREDSKELIGAIFFGE